MFALLVIPLFVPLMVIYMCWERLNKDLRPILVGLAVMLSMFTLLVAAVAAQHA
jgi:hypothetical protein